jgi:hypothetical protein
VRRRAGAGGYHACALHTPRMVRNSLIYALGNARKHLRAVAGIDPCSSARRFDGFRRPLPPSPDEPPTRPPRTWLLRIGWPRHGLLSLDDATRGAVRGRRRVDRFTGEP